MEKFYQNIGKYGEKMVGKFSHKPSGNGIVISVTSPFVKEIHVESDNDIHTEFFNTYSLLEPQAEHPEGQDRCIYYNTEEQCYYRSEWQLINLTPENPQWGYVWVQANRRYILEHARKCEKLQAHYRSYHDIHKGQLCVFTGYAIDPNGDFKKPSTVESKLILDNRTKWFYNPWSFEVSLLNEDTIDDFVGGGTPISEKMAKKIVRYHKIERKTQKRARTREWWRNLLDKLSKFVQSVEKYPTWSVAIISAIATFFLSNIGTILKWFLKQSGG